MKEYLSQKGVEFTVKDITEDPQAIHELVEVYHCMGTPVVVIDGQVVQGFYRERIDKLLAGS